MDVACAPRVGAGFLYCVESLNRVPFVKESVLLASTGVFLTISIPFFFSFLLPFSSLKNCACTPTKMFNRFTTALAAAVSSTATATAAAISPADGQTVLVRFTDEINDQVTRGPPAPRQPPAKANPGDGTRTTMREALGPNFTASAGSSSINKALSQVETVR